MSDDDNKLCAVLGILAAYRYTFDDQREEFDDMAGAIEAVLKGGA